ncbi:MAG: NUDIX hydrolase [Caldilineaceae bacterium]|nr:NUDIX hydrolase [Caldilineaceae bacterium]
MLLNQARKRVAAGAFFLDEEQRILLVNPTYKPQWEIPGGMVEESEAPREACQREIAEELGLTIIPGYLLSIGYLPAKDARGDSLRFIFWGGVLDALARTALHLPADELSEYRFVTLEEAAALVTPSLHGQLGQCLANLQLNGQIYWEGAS